MNNVYKYLPIFAPGATAEFVDGEPFKTIIRLQETSVKISVKASVKTKVKTKKQQKRIDLQKRQRTNSDE